MAIRFTKAQAKQFGVRLAKKPQEKKPRRTDGYDSQLEADYAQRLTHLWMQKSIKKWVYHPWQFILIPGTKPVRYTPDFLVIPLTGRWEIHETKGYWRRADRIVIKLCAEKWPEFRVLGVTREHGLWDMETF